MITRQQVRRPAARFVAALVLLSPVLAWLTGCGTNDLVLRVDLLSFTPELQAPFVFPPVPATPGGLATGEQALVADQDVNLVDGLGDAVALKNASLRLRTVAAATTGTGTDTVRVYLSDASTLPRSTPPVLTQVLTFNAGVPDTVTSETSQDARLTALFAQKQLRIAVTTSFRGPSTGASLAGSLSVIALDVVVVAGRKLN